MSTKATIYYDELTECFQDSTDQSLNLLCELSSLVELDVANGWLTLEWQSDSMPNKLRLPMQDLRRISLDCDGLMIEMADDCETAKKIWLERGIQSFAILAVS